MQRAVEFGIIKDEKRGNAQENPLSVYLRCI